MSNLTTFQQKLVDDLIKEFTKINPKPTNGVTKRFSFDTIAECQKEEERFLATVAKHNATMVKVFKKQLDDEIKAFTKEFGKVFELQMGYKYNSNSEISHGYDEFIEANTDAKKTQDSCNYHEMWLFIVSKTKPYYDGSSTNSRGYCNGKQFHTIYVNFLKERVGIKLDSGKEVGAYKIKGLAFKNKEYLYEDRGDLTKVATLDEFIQTDKATQRRLVEMAS